MKFLKVPDTLWNMTEKRSNQEVGQVVMARRLHLKMAPGDVVARAGVDPKTYASLEDGKRWPQESSRLKIEQALRWAPGSIARVRDGGDPTPVEDEPDADLASRMLHPSRRIQVTDLIASSTDMAEILNRLVTYGRVGDGDRAKLEAALDDIRIEKFPQVYASLSRPGKLRVAEFGSHVQSEEFINQQEEEIDDLETAAQSDAQDEAQQGEEGGSWDGPESWPSGTDWPTGDDPGVDSGEDTKDA